MTVSVVTGSPGLSATLLDRVADSLSRERRNCERCHDSVQVPKQNARAAVGEFL